MSIAIEPRPINGYVAIFLCLAYFAMPFSTLRAILGFLSIVYIWIGNHSVQSMGFGFRLTRNAKIALIILSIAMIVILPITATGISIIENFSREEAAISDSTQLRQEPIDELSKFYFFGFGENFHAALHEKDLSAALRNSIKPAFALLIIAPVLETALVFAILFPVFWKKLGFAWGMVAVGLFFSLAHVQYLPNLFVLLVIFIHGVVMAGLFAYTGSIYPSVLVHFWINLQAMITYFIFNWGLPPPH